jgi:poly(glycerol-phosphate) alpha-glucosyltransferase
MTSAEDLAGLRIGLLTASASRLGGGVFEAVAAQAALIRAAGGEAQVFALEDAFAAADARRFAPSPIGHARVLGPAMVGYAPQLTDMLVTAELDCLHLHGIWMYPSHAAARWVARTARPCVISPHGMLAPWITARGRAKKRVARVAYERASWRAARLMHALTDSEATDIARETGREAIVIPNAAPRPSPAHDTLPPPTLLSIGRIHPKKNLDALLAAWAKLRPTLPADLAQARLIIAGWGEPAHVAAFERDVAAAGRGVSFVGPVYGEAKARLLAEARFVVLPSHSEGLPMAILEAWAAGVPTVMSAACNLGIGFAAGAAIDSGTGVDGIATALVRALQLPAGEWQAMAAAARALAQGPFAPSTVQAAWTNAYRSLVDKT